MFSLTVQRVEANAPPANEPIIVWRNSSITEVMDEPTVCTVDYRWQSLDGDEIKYSGHMESGRPTERTKLGYLLIAVANYPSHAEKLFPGDLWSPIMHL